MGSDFQLLDYINTDGVCEITLTRPPVNALSHAMLDELLAALRRAGEDPAVRVVLLKSGVPDVFCAGLDLDVMLNASPAEKRRALEKLYPELYRIQHTMTKPTIAVVDGAARGGGMTVAISCDMIVASDRATFKYPEIDIGVLPAIHFVHLPRVAGRYRAFDLLFTCREFDVREAFELGLVSRVFAAAEVDGEAYRLAAQLAAKSPSTLRMAKNAFMRANDWDYQRGIASAVEDFCNAAAAPDAREGLQAFLEKRPPVWEED